MGTDLQAWGLSLKPVDFVLWSTFVKIFLSLNLAVTPALVPIFAEDLEFTV